MAETTDQQFARSHLCPTSKRGRNATQNMDETVAHRQKQRKLQSKLIFDELLNGEANDVRMYIRMSPDMYQLILDKVTPLITKQDTHLRDSIGAGSRLEATLQYLELYNMELYNIQQE
ncbi:hypothetical protein GWK47_003292 [Chionoecetes opilio]|uniref:Uncharacterized protein n=1 Tax=Chionoecetes opilio TaxID=41210 RepID=A0A8J4YLC5_CHIOP|nr:hypothetical protein GWK47_003292 [Chionoecetes opilio]